MRAGSRVQGTPAQRAPVVLLETSDCLGMPSAMPSAVPSPLVVQRTPTRFLTVASVDVLDHCAWVVGHADGFRRHFQSVFYR